MSVYLAIKTKILIDEMLERDQGNAWRAMLKKVLPHMDDAYRDDEDGQRTHLGASQLGEDCARKLWYDFRWVKRGWFNGQILRLFNRGHIEEGRVIALLLAAGIRVYQQDVDGKQFRISILGGHIGGSGDGRSDNIPDLPVGTWCGLEFKTHNEKYFTGIAGKPSRDRAGKRIRIGPPGVITGHPSHHVQMILYMDKMGLPYTLYIAVNKDTDELHMEIVVANPELAKQYIDRGINIVLLPTPPKRISESISFWQCNFCDDKFICHKKAKADVNCRTCTQSQPREDGTWYCHHFCVILSKEKQKAGCPDHVMMDMSC